MSMITHLCVVGPDGNIVVPVGVERAGVRVKVTVDQPDTGADPRPQDMTEEQWRAFVVRTAGSVDDTEFKRPDQGEFEQRMPLE